MERLSSTHAKSRSPAQMLPPENSAVKPDAPELWSAETPFPGFPDIRANVTFVPMQFFTLVLPYQNRGVSRLVGYMLRQILGYCDERGNPRGEQQQFSYNDLIRYAGIGRNAIADTLKEAQDGQFIRCLQEPRPDRAGQKAQQGIYELNWDTEGAYTNHPEEFRGFFFPEAYVDESGESNRAKAARKNIPNIFFDYVLKEEPLSVSRVLGALLFKSIQWGSGGERKVPISLSITELSRLTHMTRANTHKALSHAVEVGYITRSEAGVIDLNGGNDNESKAATYQIRWTSNPVLIDRSEKDNGTSPKRITGDQSEKDNGRRPTGPKKITGRRSEKDNGTSPKKVTGDQSEKDNGISIKNTNIKNTTSIKTAALKAAVAAEDGLFDQLISFGIHPPTLAKNLIETLPASRIKNQLEWLPMRAPRKNAAGLLLKAIQEDWPKPEVGSHRAEGGSLGEIFAQHYYAGYGGNEGSPVASPTGKDVAAADPFVQHFMEKNVQGKNPDVADWGRMFGKFVKDKHARQENPLNFCSIAITTHGDEFFSLVERKREKEIQKRIYEHLTQAQEGHEKRFADAYYTYLANQQKEILTDEPSEREAFEQWLTDRTQLLREPVSERMRLNFFKSYVDEFYEEPLLDFWQWDAELNPESFDEEAVKQCVSLP